MPRQNLIACALVAAIASALPFAAALDEALAAQAAAQTSRQEGVTVTVAPPGFARGAKTWDFAITLETHTQPLDDDLVNGTTLLTDGNPYRPLGWKGSPPGGHHRKGVLSFAVVTPRPQAVELQIRRPGEASPRVFRWKTGP
jgi:hypothetical protein